MSRRSEVVGRKKKQMVASQRSGCRLGDVQLTQHGLELFFPQKYGNLKSRIVFLESRPQGDVRRTASSLVDLELSRLESLAIDLVAHFKRNGEKGGCWSSHDSAAASQSRVWLCWGVFFIDGWFVVDQSVH